jgi:hypothetical protein
VLVASSAHIETDHLVVILGLVGADRSTARTAEITTRTSLIMGRQNIGRNVSTQHSEPDRWDNIGLIGAQGKLHFGNSVRLESGRLSAAPRVGYLLTVPLASKLDLLITSPSLRCLALNSCRKEQV